MSSRREKQSPFEASSKEAPVKHSFSSFVRRSDSPRWHLFLQIQFQTLEIPGIGKPNWFLLTLLSPYAGVYYWKSGDRVDDCSVKLMTNDEETENEITVQGSEEELERMWRTLEWQEKGMVKVEGILESRRVAKNEQVSE